MNKEDVEKILKKIALEYADKFNYNKAHEDKRKSKSRIGMHFISSDTDENYYFTQYGKTNTYNYKKNGGKVEFRYRFSHPRLDIYLPNRKGFASLEFSDFNIETKEDTGIWRYSESQIFNKEGIDLFNEMYKRFFNLYEELKGSDK